MPLKIFLIIWLKRNKVPKQNGKLHIQKHLDCLPKALQLIIYPVSALAGLSGISPVSWYVLRVKRVWEQLHLRPQSTKEEYKNASPLQHVSFITEPENSSVPSSVTEIGIEHNACPGIRLMTMTFPYRLEEYMNATQDSWAMRLNLCTTWAHLCLHI